MCYRRINHYYYYIIRRLKPFSYLSHDLLIPYYYIYFHYVPTSTTYMYMIGYLFVHQYYAHFDQVVLGINKQETFLAISNYYPG